VPAESLSKLKELSEFVDEIANVRHDPRQPWVGETAFAHKGGMHVHAIDRVARSYEHIQPETIGNRRRVLVSDMAGRTNILLKAAELGFKLAPDAPETRQITAKVKEREAFGYEYEAAEASLALLIRGTLDHNPELFFTVDSYHVSMRQHGNEAVCEATIKVRVGQEVHHTVAEGDGPVNALDQALRRALIKSFPQLSEVELVDYKVRILDVFDALHSDDAPRRGKGKSPRAVRRGIQEVTSGSSSESEPPDDLARLSGTAARTRVLIQTTDGKSEWGTVGVDPNIITASLEALVDSMEYALLKQWE
jgi:2-isopropylmalate synthase